MRIHIEATEHLVNLDGVECRRWIGVTEDGTVCEVFVHRIAVAAAVGPERGAQFDRQLRECLPPGQHVELAAIL